MKGKNEQIRGSVSIFLVIILVPMLVVSSLFVDAGKMSLSEGLVASAADLALNSAMANYDSKLKDFYGLFATAQNTDELLSDLEYFYIQSITSAGVPESEAKTYVSGCIEGLERTGQSGNIDDLLKIENTSFDIGPTEDGTLANASVLKKQIVEFMKFRGPINTGLGFLESLKTFATLSKQQELIDKKQEYYQVQNKALDEAYQAWQKISDYNKTKIITDSEFFPRLEDNLKAMKEEIPKYAENAAKDFYHEMRLDQFDFSSTYPELFLSVTSNGEEDYYNFSVDGRSYKVPEEFSEDKVPSENNLITRIRQCYQYKSNLDNAWESLVPMLDTSNSYFPQLALQLKRDMDRGEGFDKLYKSMESYCKECLKLKQMWEFAEDDLKSLTNSFNGDKIEKTYNEYYEDVIYDFYEFAASSDTNAANSKNGFEKYNSDASRIKSCFENASNHLRTANEYGENEYLHISSRIQEVSASLNDAADNLNRGKMALDDCISSLTSLKGLIEKDLADAKQNWETAVNDKAVKSTTLAKQDKAELESLSKFLNGGEIDKLQKRIEGISGKLGEVINVINETKFLGVSVKDIDSIQALQNALQQKTGDQVLNALPLNTDELSVKVYDLYGANSMSSPGLDLKWRNNSNCNPILSQDTPNFYSYLYSHFNKGEVSTSTEEKQPKETTENKKANFSTLKDDLSNAAKIDTDKQAISNENELSSLSNRPSKKGKNGSVPGGDGTNKGSSAPKENSKKTTSLFSSLTKGLSNMAETLRDNLYISDYIISMFSYDTIEKEAVEKAAKEKAADPKAEMKIQTITKEDINETNNWAMGSEVEYILYGGTNSSNKTKAAATIYGIRLALNLVYAFTDTQIRGTALAVATPLSAATLGIIPVPLIQGAIIIGLSCIESGIDLAQIKDGKAVRLYKTRDTWTTSPSGLAKYTTVAVGEFAKDAAGEAITWGNNNIQKLLDMSEEELTKFTSESAKNAASLVNNYEEELLNTVNKQIGIVTDRLITLANQAVEMGKSDTSLDQVAYVKQELKKTIDSQPDGPIKEALYSAYDYILSEGLVEQVLSQVQKSVDECGSDISQELQGYINKISGYFEKTIRTAESSVNKAIKDASSSLKNSMNEGAGALKDSLNNGIDKLFGQSNIADTEKESSGVASLLFFSYSDYLRLLTLIGMYTASEAVLLRTADVVQQNMIHTGDEDFTMEKSYTYLELSADYEVEPVLLPLPLFTDVVGDPGAHNLRYKYEYKDTKGY